MHYPGYNSGKVILTESEWFPFRIHNHVKLQDEEWYYILLDINGLKHFMPVGFYQNYGFKTGDLVSCKIEKINCTGRVFLEPRHPFYEEGESYYFDFISYFPGEDSKKGILAVKEISGNSIHVPLSGNENPDLNKQKKVRCRVKSIKRGAINLEYLPDIR